MVDRESRYAKKGGDTESKVTSGAASKAAETAGDRGGEGGDGANKKTPGAEPTKEPKSEMGEVSGADPYKEMAGRHEREMGDMHKRHMRERSDTQSRQESEHADMHKRHTKEIQDFMDKQASVSPDDAAPATGASPAMGQGGAPTAMAPGA